METIIVQVKKEQSLAKEPNITMIVTDQEYAQQALPAGVTLQNRIRLHNQGAKFYHHPGDNYCLDSIPISDVDQTAYTIYTYDRLH